MARAGKPFESHPAHPSLPPRAKYLEALAQYEQGVEALQRHDYATATDHLRQVIARYPDERELQERARLYLNVCQQRLSNGPVGRPASVEERVFAATLAINAGRHNEAYDYLREVEREDPEHDYAHYLSAVVCSARGEAEAALDHLRRAIVLNPENRNLALTDGDLATLRAHEGFRAVIDSVPAGASRRRARARR
jgi:tetratricopeptide (TPR) repeat protein